VLWSDEVTFLIGGRSAKEKVTRKRRERTCETCIQHQFHRGHTAPVHAWGAIGYGYKSQLILIKGSGKAGAFKQVDYPEQILKPYIQPILEAFALKTHNFALSPSPSLWRRAIQLTGTNQLITVAPNGEQPTGLS
jgi:hypothetical protein